MTMAIGKHRVLSFQILGDQNAWKISSKKLVKIQFQCYVIVTQAMLMLNMTNGVKLMVQQTRILAQDTQALLIDVQERLFPHIADRDTLLKKLEVLLKGLQILNIPIMKNQQYSKALGETLPELNAILQSESQIFEKRTFSCCDTAESMQYIQQQNRRCVLLFGIETHVCVLQTAMDLLTQGFQPILVVDAVSSRSLADKEIAIQRMQQAGVILTSVESILFELCRDSLHPDFKAISNLVK